MRSFADNLKLYAQLVVREGVALAPGQEVLIFAERDQNELVHLIAREAYQAGAKNVEVFYRDAELTRIRYANGSDDTIAYAPNWMYDAIARAHKEGAARIGILSQDPELLAPFPAEKVAIASKATGKAAKPVSEIISQDEINWCLIGAASPEWARRVFPKLNLEEATKLLWEKIFLTARVLEDDPISAWARHSESLEARVETLNAQRFDALHFRGPGTDLKVGLVQNHVWAGGRGRAKNGVLCSPNIPTEEVFTMPHRARVDGVVSSTMPLSVRGQLVDGIRMEFKDGAAISVSAKQGEQTLKDLIATDENACRLGEVALVPNSSKVAKTGTLFYSTLYDENAASHIALGAAYGMNLAGYESLSDEQRLEHGANDSIIHVDWMIGSGEVDVDGLGADGSATPVMRSGEWVSACWPR